MIKDDRRIGVWLLGAHGGLATTVMVGARMIARGLAGETGLLTATEGFSHLGFQKIENLVFGGHDIRPSGVFVSAFEIYRENRSFDFEKLQAVKPDLDAIDADIRRGTSLNCGPAITRLKGVRVSKQRASTARVIVAAIRKDIEDFRDRHALSRVIVVNVASTELPLGPKSTFAKLADLEEALDSKAAMKHLRASTLYAYAALSAGCPLINFTPNAGSLIPALVAYARKRRLPIMGNDGKTGETLVKSALAPMFKYRNLQVLAWQGYNILGDRDGEVLSDPEHKKAKVESKDSVISKILGYPLHTHVGIDFVPSLKDQKTAWDFVHFAGFLDYKMSLQFTWQGCDAILAAPLILDMIRLASLAHDRREPGLMTHLACFFKSPVGVDEQDLHFQFHNLLAYAAGTGT